MSTKIGIIGVGRMGRRHIQVVKDLGLELTGVCDVSSASLALAAQEYNLSPDQQFVDAHMLLRQTQPDCVIIATTAPTHCEFTCLAAELEAKYILCEKPMAVSLAECDQMIETCRKYGAKLAINHQMRFMERYTEPKRIINSAAFGGLSSVTVVAGNLGIAMNGSHYLEMFRYMTDEAPHDVTAWFSPTTTPNPRGPQYEDRAGSLRVTTASGKRLYMEIGDDQGHGMLVVYAGRYGRLTVDELRGSLHLSVRKEEHRSLPTTRYGMPWLDTEYKIAPADTIAPSRSVLDALLNDRNPPTGEDGRLAVAALVAAHLSDENDHSAVCVDLSNLPTERTFPWA